MCVCVCVCACVRVCAFASFSISLYMRLRACLFPTLCCEAAILSCFLVEGTFALCDTASCLAANCLGSSFTLDTSPPVVSIQAVDTHTHTHAKTHITVSSCWQAAISRVHECSKTSQRSTRLSISPVSLRPLYGNGRGAGRNSDGGASTRGGVRWVAGREKRGQFTPFCTLKASSVA